MSITGLLKANVALISTIGLSSALISALIVWVTTLGMDAGVELATVVGQRAIALAVIVPLIMLGFMYLRRDKLVEASPGKLAIVFGLIGAGGGLFSALIYLYIGFQVPALFKSVDLIIHMDNMLPPLMPAGLATVITSTIAGLAGSFMFGKSGE